MGQIMQHIPYRPPGGGGGYSSGTVMPEFVGRGFRAGWRLITLPFRLITRLFQRRARAEDEQPAEGTTVDEAVGPAVKSDFDVAPPPSKEETPPEPGRGVDREPPKIFGWIRRNLIPDFEVIRTGSLLMGGLEIMYKSVLLGLLLIPAVIILDTTAGTAFEDLTDLAKWVLIVSTVFVVYPAFTFLVGLFVIVVLAFPSLVGKFTVDLWRLALRGVARVFGGLTQVAVTATVSGIMVPPPNGQGLSETDDASGGEDTYQPKNWLIGMIVLAVLIGGGVAYKLYDEGPWPPLVEGYRHFDSARYQEATDHFSRITTKYPDFAEGHAALGHALTAREQFEEAISAYSRAIAIDDEYVGGYVGRGWVRWFTQRLEGAAEDYRAAVRLDPGVYAYYQELARILDELDRPGETARFWKDVAKSKPEWAATARVKRVQALEKDENWRDLRKEIPAMLRTDAHKNNPHLHFLMGRALNDVDRYRQAIGYLERAVNMVRGKKAMKHLLRLYGDELKYTYVWNGDLTRAQSWERELNQLVP